MQNIERFQEAAKAYGVPVTEVFQTVDLWERKNIPGVTKCIFALGRTVRVLFGYIFSIKPQAATDIPFLSYVY